MALVNIYIKDPVVTRLKRDQKIPIIGFVANTGGLLGLCMGFSLVSAFEIIYHFLISVYHYFTVAIKDKEKKANQKAAPRATPHTPPTPKANNCKTVAVQTTESDALECGESQSDVTVIRDRLPTAMKVVCRNLNFPKTERPAAINGVVMGLDNNDSEKGCGRLKVMNGHPNIRCSSNYPNTHLTSTLKEPIKGGKANHVPILSNSSLTKHCIQNKLVDRISIEYDI